MDFFLHFCFHVYDLTKYIKGQELEDLKGKFQFFASP